MSSALLLVDVQNDFLPGGALPVPCGDQVVPVANRLMREHDVVIASQDWHPPDHGSFASQHPGHAIGDVIELDGLEQILWPDHCVQETAGASFASALEVQRIDAVVRKGLDRRIDSYSAFFDNGRRRATGLEQELRRRAVDELHVVGLATDYCVKYTVLDARELGFDTIVHRAGIRAVGLAATDEDEAHTAMTRAGARLV